MEGADGSEDLVPAMAPQTTSSRIEMTAKMRELKAFHTI
jgi:hypothetical protein